MAHVRMELGVPTVSALTPVTVLALDLMGRIVTLVSIRFTIRLYFPLG